MVGRGVRFTTGVVVHINRVFPLFLSLRQQRERLSTPKFGLALHTSFQLLSIETVCQVYAHSYVGGGCLDPNSHIALTGKCQPL